MNTIEEHTITTVMYISILIWNVLGVMLVHDLTNKNSHSNLKKWISELLMKSKTSSDSFRRKTDININNNRYSKRIFPLLYANNYEITIIITATTNNSNVVDWLVS